MRYLKLNMLKQKVYLFFTILSVTMYLGGAYNVYSVYTLLNSKNTDRDVLQNMLITNIGMGVLITISVVSLLVIMLPFLKRLTGFERQIRETAKDGNLERSINDKNKDELSNISDAYNDLLLSFKTIISKFQFESKQMSIYAGGLEKTVTDISHGSQQQYDAAQDVVDAIAEFTRSMASVEQNSKQTEQIASFAHSASETGITVVTEAKQHIHTIALAVSNSITAITNLSTSSDNITAIAKDIHEIAAQTNLLALNAAIEAARAGESGRGFAVVADEVRKLAERTSIATQEITELTNTIKNNISTATTSIANCDDKVQAGTSCIEKAVETLNVIKTGADETSSNVDDVAKAIAAQTASVHNIASNVDNIFHIATDNKNAAINSKQNANHLMTIADGIQEIELIFGMSTYGPAAIAAHNDMPALAQNAALEITKTIEQAISSRQLTIQDLMSKTKTLIPNTKPEKYQTPFDTVMDKILPPVQERILASSPRIAYAIATNIDGYVPTHNNKFCEPLTGDEAYDLIHNRTKRFFTDRVGLRCGSHTQPYLLQTYRRDTGEILHDISVPIYIDGQHWGGFRIGYKV